jgi:hypothetical protein
MIDPNYIKANTILLDLYDVCFQAHLGVLGESDPNKMKVLSNNACEYCMSRFSEVKELEAAIMKKHRHG